MKCPKNTLDILSNLLKVNSILSLNIMIVKFLNYGRLEAVKNVAGEVFHSLTKSNSNLRS